MLNAHAWLVTGSHQRDHISRFWDSFCSCLWAENRFQIHGACLYHLRNLPMIT